MELCDVSRRNLFLTCARGLQKVSAKFIGWDAKLSLERTRKGLVTLETRIDGNPQNRLFTDLQAIGCSVKPQPADVFLGRFADRLSEDTMKMIRGKPDASCQDIQVQLTLEMGLNVDERRENCLLVLFVVGENHSASQPKYTIETGSFLDFSCYFVPANLTITLAVTGMNSVVLK